jgi:hypothetical protein
MAQGQQQHGLQQTTASIHAAAAASVARVYTETRTMPVLQTPAGPGRDAVVPPLLPYQHHQLATLWREFPTQQQAFDFIDSLPLAMHAQAR